MRLVALALKSSLIRSVKVNVLMSDVFMALSFGPYTMFLPMFPNVPGAGDAKALTLNHELMVWPPGTAFGSPTTFGYHRLFDDRE